jgi:hypothetical protein
VSEILVFVRATCPLPDCSGGKIYAPMIHTGPGPAPPFERDCDNCGGKGYVEEWRDLGELINEAVRKYVRFV